MMNGEGYRDPTPYLASKHARAGEIWTVMTQYGPKPALLMQVYENIIRVLYIYPTDRLQESEYTRDLKQGRIDIRQLTWTVPAELVSYAGRLPKELMVDIETQIAKTLEHYKDIVQGGDCE